MHGGHSSQQRDVLASEQLGLMPQGSVGWAVQTPAHSSTPGHCQLLDFLCSPVPSPLLCSPPHRLCATHLSGTLMCSPRALTSDTGIVRHKCSFQQPWQALILYQLVLAL